MCRIWGSRAGAVLHKTFMFVNTASKFIACDTQSITVTPVQAANVNICSVLMGTLASFDPGNPTDSCTWIMRKVIGITPAGATTTLSTVPATLDDVVLYLNYTFGDAPDAQMAAVLAAEADKNKKSWYKKLAPKNEATNEAVVAVETLFDLRPVFDSHIEKATACLVCLGSRLRLGCSLTRASSGDQQQNGKRVEVGARLCGKDAKITCHSSFLYPCRACALSNLVRKCSPVVFETPKVGSAYA
jgi:hypothetical protein